MGKKNQNTINRPKSQANVRKQPVTVKPAGFDKRAIILISIAIVVTAIVYAVSLGNGWTRNWDDGGYVTESTGSDILSAGNIYHLSGDDIAKIFTTFYKGNYHPLTTIVYALEYKLVHDSPVLYHLINLLFHLVNVVLVFLFVKRLLKNPEIAFITAIFFGIHPMHVESVAWVSELKDVMYAFFFMLSVLFYMKFYEAKEKTARYYLISLILFILSCLSKSAAVTLPAVLVLIDFYKDKKWKSSMANHSNAFMRSVGKLISSVIQKTPFFIVSFVFGVVAVFSQKSAGAIQDLNPLFSWFERPMLASYAAMMYLVKLIVPIDLAAMYPYPDRVDGHLPYIYYLAPIIIFILAYMVYYSRKFSKDIIFATFFFLITIVLVLQLLPVGGAILAERYSYIPYIGMFMIVGKGYVFSQESKAKFASILKWLYPAILVIALVAYSVLTVQRIKVWKDGEVLFTDLIRKYPNLPFAYNNRGYLYYRFLKKYDKALEDYNKCIEIDPTFHRALSNRGVLYYNFFGDSKSDSLHLQLALSDFSNALKYKSDNTDALIGRANTYSTLLKYKESIPDYDNYIREVSDDAKAYLWRGIAEYNTGKYDEAFADVNKCLEMKPDNDNAFLWRGIIFSQKKDYKAAIKDFDQMQKLNPNSTDLYNWRGLAKFNLQMYTEAIEDYNIAIAKNPNEPTVYINRSSTYLELKNYKQAYDDYCSAGKLKYALDKAHFFKLKALAGDNSFVE
jgi:protein O-mannosyl-transferase